MKNIITEADKLFHKGIPIIPLADKRPVIHEWQKWGKQIPTINQHKRHLSKIKTGIGIPLGETSGLIAIDVDTVDPIELGIIRRLLPPTPITKYGEKGYTAFYKHNGEKSQKIKSNNKGYALELLSSGNQTVVPPSIHPNTKMPYFYADKSLVDIDHKKLPTLPSDTIDKIRLALQGHHENIENDTIIIGSEGRNNKLKEIVTARFHDGKDIADIAKFITQYDEKNHSPPLFKDKSEGINKDDSPHLNAARFVQNIVKTIEALSLPPSLDYKKSGPKTQLQINILTVREFLEEGRYPTPEPVIEGIMNRGEMHICSAPAKTGKTFLQLNLAIALATGGSFLNKFSVKRMKTLIIQTEVSPANFQKRVRKAVNENLDEIEDYLLIPDSLAASQIQLDRPEGIERLEEIIKLCSPDFLILDPFYTLSSANEDSSQEIGKILSNLRELLIRNNLTCLIVHHQGKGTSSNTHTGHKHRGSSSFADASDGNWSLTKSAEDKMAKITFELRNYESPSPLTLKLDDNLVWSACDFADIEDEKKLTTSHITTALLLNGELCANDLIQFLIAETGASKRCIQGKLRTALNNQEICKRSEGRKSIYYIGGLQE